MVGDTQAGCGKSDNLFYSVQYVSGIISSYRLRPLPRVMSFFRNISILVETRENVSVGKHFSILRLSLLENIVEPCATVSFSFKKYFG